MEYAHARIRNQKVHTTYDNVVICPVCDGTRCSADDSPSMQFVCLVCLDCCSILTLFVRIVPDEEHLVLEWAKDVKIPKAMKTLWIREEKITPDEVKKERKGIIGRLFDI